MNNLSFWEKDMFQSSYDLIVVGAGITGLSSALFFKRALPGKSVLVLERGPFPIGASTRNAGFACIGSITEHQADLERTSEEEIKNRIRHRYEGLQLLKSTLGEEAISYTPCGGYELFNSEDSFGKAKVLIPTFNDWLLKLTGEEEVYSSQELNGYPVIHNRLEGALHPGKLMRTLIRKAEEEGVKIRWNAFVQKVDSAGFIMLDDGTEFVAEQVLVATNGFAGSLLPDLEINPARGIVFVTGPIDKLPWEGTFHHDRGYIYFRNIGDHLLLGGARNIAEEEEQTDHFGINPNVKESLVQFADNTLKLPEGWHIDHEWSGIMGFTKTKTPIIKQAQGRVYVAAGLSGMGIAIGMKVGKQAVAMLNPKSK